MPNIAAILLIFASLIPRLVVARMIRQRSRLAGSSRRILDSQGQPVRKGKVFFGPREGQVPFTEESTASLDNEGRYRIVLKDFPFGNDTMPATGQLRFMVLSPGFRLELGKCEAGSDPLVVDMRLTPEPWKETRVRFVNRHGKAVADVNVDLRIGSQQVWEKLISNAEGRCRVASPAGLGFSITARPEDYLTESFGFRARRRPRRPDRTGVRPDPGRIVDPEGKPLSGIQIGGLSPPTITSTSLTSSDRCSCTR